jgi:hypothetical protein
LIGWSEICLPETLWQQVDQQQLTAIIAHELAHVKRLDSVWLFFWHLMSIVFFFQPLNKLSQLNFQSRAEFLADAIAVRQTQDPVAMVNSLMSAARLTQDHGAASMAAHLLGSDATIVARTKSLLTENPLQTCSPLAFIAQLLDITIGRSDAFKRNRLKAYTNARPQPITTDAYQLTTEMLIRALTNDKGVYSAADWLLVKAMIRSPDDFHRAKPMWSTTEIATLQPFTTAVAHDEAAGGQVTVNDHGLLEVHSSNAAGLIQRATYYLNNQAFYQLFITASGKPYVPMATEKAMVRFLARLHFGLPPRQLTWLEE